ncbi:hypothetical protein OG762_25235 [Streptomyces sp. NBC_01136]|uniref:TetR family transcriptional regulator C-terminal domain-containing protein n=1 Tax=unclassified Streptomyces TaxID=2593676 RepID=UPI003255666A|nr:hypothetical protein OG762_25235 [Streptomyces sp. NBC_01136]
MIESTAVSLPYVVVDGAGREIEPVSRYLRDLLLGDVSPLTCRSYGHDLLRWFRLLLCAMSSGTSKRQLFSEVVQRYAHTYGSYGTRALAEPTARGAVETLLRLAAAEYTDPTHPPGCLVINGATNCTPAAEDVKVELRAFREGTKRALEEKINADIGAGRLPEGADAGALATFYAAVIQGMSTQACDGVGREDLERVVETALNAWPTSAPHEARSNSGTAPGTDPH